MIGTFFILIKHFINQCGKVSLSVCLIRCIHRVPRTASHKKLPERKQARSFYRKFLNVKIIFAYSLTVLSSLINVTFLRHMELKYFPLIEVSVFCGFLSFNPSCFYMKKPSSKTLLEVGIIILGITCFGPGTL